VKALVDNIWDAAAQQTQEGYDCNTGAAACTRPVKGKMVLVQPSEADRAQLAKIREVVLNKWAARCSAQCVSDFNGTVGKLLKVTVVK
jgi:hypothetical protein